MRSYAYLLGIALATIQLCGCGDARTTVTVSGAVTYNGQPVEFGSIQFHPVGGTGQIVGGDIADGRYAVDVTSPGSRKVFVKGKKKINHGMTTEEAIKRTAEAQAAGKDWAGHVAEPADYIPEDAQGNGQEVELKQGEQTIDFAITGPPRS